MTMHHGCTVQCTCMSTRNADQTRPDQTRPDPSLTHLCASTHRLCCLNYRPRARLKRKALEAME